jgi:hypothetical protein
VVRRREAPVFCWIELNPNHKPKIPLHAEQIAQGVKIVLARVSVKNCQLETLSITTRRNVRPERLPYIACGRTPAGATEWEPWTTGGQEQQLLGVRVQVDTSEAQFASVPCYSARVLGELSLDQEEFFPGLFNLLTIGDEPSPTQFTAYVLMPFLQFLEDENALIAFCRENWRIEWMGVEG